MLFSTDSLKNRAIELNFNIAGVIQAEPAPTLESYFRWIEGNMHGDMGYLARPDRQIRRKDLNAILPSVHAMILVGLDYRTLPIPDEILADPSRGRIASYAWGFDYHDVMTSRLETLAQWIEEESGMKLQRRVYVDTGAILERAHAQQAGMGFVGKNTMLIHPRRGSYFFLGEILTDLEFDEYDTPHKPTMCGNCRRCLIACPTNAFPEPYVLDSRRCISYLTIEHKGWINRELRLLMGNWIFGCDICQDVCPWQRFAVPSQEQTLYPSDTDRAAPPLLDVLTINKETFKSRFYGSPIYRIRRERLVRNACIAAGNWGSEIAIPALTTLLDDDSPLIRGHAAWAIGQILGASAKRLLSDQRQRETDTEVIDEISQTLDEL